jgi:hypothetical protein
VDGTMPTIQEMQDAEEYTAYSERLDHPDVPLHMLGGLYIKSLNDVDGWSNVSRTISKWLGGFTNKASEQLVDKLFGVLNTLQDKKLIQRFNLSIRLHPQYQAELDFPPVAKDFEEITTSYLSRRPLGTVGAFCVYNYLQSTDPDFTTENLTPNQYWAGRYELERLILRGVVERVPSERAYVRLPKAPYASLGDNQDELDARINQSRYGAAAILNGDVTQQRLEEKLEEAGLRSNSQLRKPKQRQRWRK